MFVSLRDLASLATICVFLTSLHLWTNILKAVG